MFCNKCGEILTEGTRRCPVCGASQRKATSKVNSECDHPHGRGLSFQSFKEQLETASQSYQQNTWSGSHPEKPTGEDFIRALRDFFTRYADFRGRSSRRDYWLLFPVLALGDLLILGSVLGAVWAFLLMIPSLSLTVRRLHDIGKPGSWVLLSLIPFVGSILLLVQLARPSAPSNQWGPRAE